MTEEPKIKEIGKSPKESDGQDMSDESKTKVYGKAPKARDEEED